MNVEGDPFFLKLKEEIDNYEKEKNKQKKALLSQKRIQRQKERRAEKAQAKQKYEEATCTRTKPVRQTTRKRKPKQDKESPIPYAMEVESCSPIRTPTPEPDMRLDFETFVLVNEDIAISVAAKEKEEEEQFHRQQEAKRSWAEKDAKVHTTWREFRNTLLNCTVEMEYLPSETVCQACHGKNAHISCTDCHKYLCPKCDRLAHRLRPFHNRKLWKDNRFLPLQPLETTELNPAGVVSISKTRVPVPCLLFQGCPLCESRNVRLECEESLVTVFHSKGRYQLHKTRFVCNNDVVGCDWSKTATAEDYVRSGYWPDIPDDSFSCLFRDDVLRLWHTLRLSCPELQERPFLDAISNRLSHPYEAESEVPVPVFARVASEYTFLRHMKSEYVYRDYESCTACGSSPHMAHCDIIHELCREADVSNGEYPSSYGSKLFISDSKLLNHTTSIAPYEQSSTEPETEQVCTSSAQHTAKISHSSVELDQTGLAVASCSHGTVLRTANVYSGQDFASTHAIHLELTRKGTRYLSHDRLCKYWPWAQKIAKTSPTFFHATANVQPALSRTHAKTHPWPCQFRWNGLWKLGAGDTSGEENEKLRSYLKRLVSTKNLSKTEREEAIVSACFFWNETLIDRLPVSLCQRLLKAEKTLAEMESVCRELCQKFHIGDSTVPSLQEELEQIAVLDRSSSITEQTLGGSAEIIDVCTLNRRIEELQLELSLKDQASTSVRSIVPGRGTGSRNQRDAKDELTKIISLLQLLEGENYVTEEMICNGRLPWYGTCTIGTIKEQLEVVDSFNLRKRCQEEILQLTKEAKTHMRISVAKRRKLVKNIELLSKALQNGGVIDSADEIPKDTFPYELEKGHTEAFLRGHVALMHAEVARLDTHLARYGYYIKQKAHLETVEAIDVEPGTAIEIVEIALPCGEF